MDEATWIYAIRHGETDWNILRRWQGQGLAPLNPAGLRQAARVAARLAGEGLTALYSSDSTRAWQTAQVIAAATGLPINPDARLREIDVGLWQGHSTDEIIALDGARFTAREADALNVRCPEGENLAEVVARVEEALNAISAAHPGGRVALVTHGGPIAAIRYLVRWRASPDLLKLKSDNTSITLLRGQGGAWEMVLENDVSHLDGDMLAEAGI